MFIPTLRGLDIRSPSVRDLFRNAVEATKYQITPVQKKNAKSLTARSRRFVSYKGLGNKRLNGLANIAAGKFKANDTLSAGAGTFCRKNS